jgi:lysophospholipase L1-like esterase
MRSKFFVGLFAIFATVALFAESVVLEPCQDPESWKKNGADVKVEACAPPAAGQSALQITLPGKTTGTLAKKFASNRDPERRSFNDYQGISFYAKGDGSDVWVGLALEGSANYVYYFPLKSTEWVKYTVPWAAFAPESQAEPIGAFGAMPPSGIEGVRFGSRWMIRVGNEPIPPHSFAVADIRWEKEVAPLAAVPKLASYADVQAKLNARQAVKIQCMGDSVTAGTGLPDKNKQRYAVLLDAYLKHTLGNDQVKVWSESVGGAGVNDLRAWINRDFAGGAPDLVTVWIGYNDKSRGHTREYFRRSLEAYLDDVARVTGGKSAVLLFTATSGTAFRWEMQDDFAEEVRAVAKARQLPCFDINAIQKKLGYDGFRELLVDTVHPNEAGHRFIAKELGEFLLAGSGRELVIPAMPEAPAAAEPAATADAAPKGEAKKWDFEADHPGSYMNSAVVSAERAAAGSKALKLTMLPGAKDHTRWYSPVFEASEGQEYVIGYDVMNALTEKNLQVFLAAYPTANGKGPFTMVLASREAGNADTWTRASGKVKVPAGTKSARILVWLGKTARGDVFVDNLTVE